MRVLVVGGGGREHALCWKIAASPLVSRVFCAPGNAGISEVAECVDISAEDIDGLLAFANDEEIDLTVVGPEGPLCQGIVDRFEQSKRAIFGPSREAALLEGDKSFCKELLLRYRIPTAAARTFENTARAVAYVEGLREFPVVVKAAGLAAGKGVMICRNAVEARAAVRQCMDEKAFGSAGERIVIEDFLEGDELSVLTITDGETIIPLEPAQDHKAVGDGDAGPNTGGMGAFSPLPQMSPRLLSQIETQILVPTVHAMNREGKRFRGVLYAGLMITQSGPKVLEFNVRFGDPETQALVMRLRSDLVPFLQYAAEGKLEKVEEIHWDPRSAVTVVAAAAGYPGPYDRGLPIRGVGFVHTDESLQVFHAGTARVNGELVSSGGRVFAVSALGKNLDVARARAYEILERTSFEGMHFRHDIGQRAAQYLK